MNMREVAIAAHYTDLGNDLRMMAGTDTKSAQESFLERRGEICDAFGMRGELQEKPFAYVNGLAIIPVSGTLINRFSGCYGYVTGYNFIRQQLNFALGDPDVKGIILDINSYGGEAAGCFELSADIAAARKIKPITGVIDSNAYSAGYAIASACSKIVLTPSGGVGSVGVVAMHVDMSKMYADWGIKVTLIYEAEHKVDGNPYEPLPKDVQANIQAAIHISYEAFVNLVAKNLGVDAQKIRDTKSQIYKADDALALGLIHAIATPNQAAQAFFDELSGSDHQLHHEGIEMTDATKEPGAEQLAATAQATAQAASEARISERARVSGIMGCEEAKGRSGLANHLAMNTDMSLDAAKAVMAAAPAEQAAPAPAAKGNAFEQVMDASKHPNVGANGGEGESSGEAKEGASLVASILQSQEKATGLKLVSSK
jgi:signal peptide peptidase SppA